MAAPGLIERLVEAEADVYGAAWEIEHVRGSPPVDNDGHAMEVLEAAVTAALGENAVTHTAQSVGNEDFSWFLERAPGAYARLGVRSIHPFIGNSPLGGGAAAPEATLTPLGRQAIREMERCSLLVDVSHANDLTFREVMRIVKRPVLDSHTACRKLRDIPRNRTDDQLRAIAATGGVVGVHFGSQMLDDLTNDPAYPAWRKVIASVPDTEARMLRQFPEPYAYLAHRYDPLNWPLSTAGAVEDGVKVPRATLSKLVDHIEHMVDVAGIDHVCIGSDYALSNICAGVESADKLPNLAAALRDRGYKEDELARILCGNLARLFEEVLPSE